MISLIFILGIFMVSGSFFAFPAFIPVLRHSARQSPQYRQILTLILSFITFVVFFVGMSYLNAVSAQIFSVIASGPSYFSDDEERDAMLRQELWLQTMIPPFMREDMLCLRGDEAVCEASRELRNFRSRDSNQNINYLIMLISVLIPTTVCGFMVRYITRDLRKEKLKMEG